MRLSTLVKFLFGNKHAINEVANCRQAVWLGLLLVISAGFAREYDGEDLVHEPWYLLVPLGASLITSLLLFALLELTSTMNLDQNRSDRFLSKYAAFLGLYWMTAPLAWLYAIPVERFLDAGDAVEANFCLLGIVSVWRVALMTRVVSVVFSLSKVASFFVVMFFADTVAMIVLWATPLPILSFMGGIRLTESEQVIQFVGFMVRFFGTISWIVWFIGVSICDACGHTKVASGHDDPSLTTESVAASRGLWGLSWISILIWFVVLPFTQGEQINRRHVETLLREERIDEAILYMSRFDRRDFPPHWSPPPHLGFGEKRPSLVDILLRLERSEAAPWVKEMFREKLVVQSTADSWPELHAIMLDDLDDETLAGYVKIIESLPEGPAMARYHNFEIDFMFERNARGFKRELTDNRRTSLEAILKLLPKSNVENEIR